MNKIIKKISLWVLGVFFIYIILDYQMIIAKIKHREIIFSNANSTQPFTQTNFIFIFEDHNKTLEDYYNKVNKIIFTYEDTVTIDFINKKRIVYIDSGAILKTISDSIDIENTYVKLRGYMGVIDKTHMHFYVDKNKMFQVKK